MTNPVLCIRKQLPDGKVTNELVTIDINSTVGECGKMLAFIVGFAEGLLTFMPGESIPVQVANYEDLNAYEQMRVRESLVVMSTIYTGHQDSPNTNLRLKVKLQLDTVPPEASIYAIRDALKEA